MHMNAEMATFLAVFILTYILASAISVSVPINHNDATQIDRLPNLVQEPCSFSFSGKWTNQTELSILPYPLQRNKPIHLYAKITAVDDMWDGSFRGNVSRPNDKWVYAFDKPVCGNGLDCPMRKGETRVYNATYPSLSTYVPKGIYSIWAEVVNQDNEVIYRLIIHNCPV